MVADERERRHREALGDTAKVGDAAVSAASHLHVHASLDLVSAEDMRMWVQILFCG